MKIAILFLSILFIVGCSCRNTQKEKEVSQSPVNNMIGINDTLGLSLHPEFSVYSIKQKQINFVLSNHSDTNIEYGGYYQYTYEDEDGIWRDVPMHLVVFDVSYVLFQEQEKNYNAILFKNTPGRYRFFLTIGKNGKEYTLMTEFRLTDNQQEVMDAANSKFIDKEETSETLSLKLKPQPRPIPTGKYINPTEISMKTEHDYYPLSAINVKITVTNYSQKEYTCGNYYILAYYNSIKQQWEPLPTDAIFEDIAWVLNPEYPTREQLIRIYTSEESNRPGKYRIYKSFNNDTGIAYAEFEIVDRIE